MEREGGRGEGGGDREGGKGKWERGTEGKERGERREGEGMGEMGKWKIQVSLWLLTSHQPARTRVFVV